MSKRLTIGLGILIFITGFLARIAGLFNDLWLDEIWSLNLLTGINSWTEIFTSIHRDNNHILNSLWNYLCGPEAAGFLYRLPSLLFSVLSVCLVWNVKKANKQIAFLACTLFASSYLMVLYGSEARGYAAVVFFSLCSFYLADSLLSKYSLSALILFWLSGIFGLFSHLSWIGFYCALLVWMSIDSLQTLGLFKTLKNMSVWHLPIIMALIFESYIDAVKIPPGSGDLHSHFDVVIDTLSIFAGGPLTSPNNLQTSLWALIWGGTVFYLLLFELLSLLKEKNNKVYFYFLLIVVLPSLELIAAPKVLFVRYFLLNLAFAYLVLAGALCRLLGGSRPKQYFAVVFLCVFFVGNLNYLKNFVQYGRGQYTKLLIDLENKNSSDEVTLGGDQDFRNGMLIDYYSSKLSQFHNIKYLSNSESKMVCPQWYLKQTQDSYYQPKESFKHDCGAEYKFEEETAFTALSGWRWILYRRQ